MRKKFSVPWDCREGRKCATVKPDPHPNVDSTEKKMDSRDGVDVLI